MAAGTYTITAEQGATYTLSIVYTDETEAPMDLTGYSARMEVRVDPADEEALLSITDGDGITLGGNDGTIGIEIDAATMSTLPAPGKYRYDLELEAVNGYVVRVIEGPFVVKPEVTR